jgi:four helix bundle suffix protein
MQNQYDKNGFIPKHGGYEKLVTFQKADIVFLGTKYFCEKYISKFDRTYDQMVQAARSGKMNILEGSMASGTSKETEIKLTNVARASLKELAEDYRDFIRVKKLPLWDRNHPYYHALTKKHMILNPTYELYKKGIESISPEVSANVLFSLTNITIYMLAQQLKRLEQDFLNEGGLRERMTKARTNMRNNNRYNQQKP